MTATLLIELGTEELPPKALAALAQAFATQIGAGIKAAGIACGEPEALASPRRLAVQIESVGSAAPDQRQERLGPAVAAAFDATGTPTAAALGFAHSCGVAVGELEQRDTDKGRRLAYQGTVAGQTLPEVLPEVLADALKRLPIPKRMRWGSSDASFVRPVHWLLALHGDSVLPLHAFGHAADRLTYGHRFMHPQAIELAHAEAYRTHLADPGYVMVDMARRRRRVQEEVQDEAHRLGGEALMHDGLIAEVTALVEWPVALGGVFDARYLELPREVLIATLENHQRYFAVVGPDAALLARFVTVANIDSPEPDKITAGNERVVRPRLADALFFWQQDRRTGLDAYVPGLARVSYQRELGTLADKSTRVAALAARLATELGVAPAPVARACVLSKADLLTDMVGEFPELQGSMGRYYALASGEPEAVADALEQQYWPRQASAAIANTDTGQVLALGDRLDTLAGAFAVGAKPSGDKDPFALRRAALGLLRTIIEAGLDLNLREGFQYAAQLQPIDIDGDTITDDFMEFCLERLRGYYAERGIGADLFAAAAASGFRWPQDFHRRLHAVRDFLALDAAGNLCGTHKRIRNILKNRIPGTNIEPELFTETAERDLHAALHSVRAAVNAYCARGDYGDALTRLADLQTPVDAFFEQVRVISDDEVRQRNRLALMVELDAVCRSVADISRLSPAEVAA